MNIISEKELRLAVALAKPVEVLDLPTYAYNKVKRRCGAGTVADVCEADLTGRLYKGWGIGKKTVYEIEQAIDSYLKDLGYEFERKEE